MPGVNSTARERAGVVAAATALLALLAATTNHQDIVRYHWDFAYAIDMATRGLRAGGLIAPFAYRFLPTEIVRALHGVFGLDVHGGFAALAFVGVVVELCALYALLRRCGSGVRDAAAATLLIALQYSQARFLLFDVYRCDALGLPFLALAMLALFARRRGLCVLLAVVGLQAREFVAIPLILLALTLFVPRLDPAGDGQRRAGLGALVVVALVLAVALPRLLIPIAGSAQSVDFQHDPQAWRHAFLYPLAVRRNLNLLYCLLSYSLPVACLATRGRLRAAWAELAPRRGLWIAYSALVLLLTWWGGTDLFRFVAYLFLPVADLLAALVRRARNAQLAYAVVATAVFNRVGIPVPQDTLAHFLDFYGGWDRTLTLATLERTLEALGWILGAQLLRRAVPAFGDRNANGAASRETAPPV